MKFWVIHAQENPEFADEKGRSREWRSNGLARVLADRGHTAIRWRSAFSHRDKVFLAESSIARPSQNYTLQYIYGPAYQRHIGLRRIKHHRALASEFTVVARKYLEAGNAPDLIHVCNVPIELCTAAVNFGAVHGIPVVVDIRDLWPDIFADLIPEPLAFLKAAVATTLNRTSSKLRTALNSATGITALTQSYLDWGLSTARRERALSDGVFPMLYPVQEETPKVETIQHVKHRIQYSEGDIVACYAGNIGSQSDFEMVIQAAKELGAQYPRLRVVIAGSGPKAAELEEFVADIPNVAMPGWLDGEELAALLHLSDIGLIAYKPVKNFLLNVPNKFSEYLAAGLAIACSIEGEMGTLVREGECGFVYADGGLESLKQGLSLLLENAAQRTEMQKAARALHKTKFDSDVVFPRFAEYLENIALESKVEE